MFTLIMQFECAQILTSKKWFLSVSIWKKYWNVKKKLIQKNYLFVHNLYAQNIIFMSDEDAECWMMSLCFGLVWFALNWLLWMWKLYNLSAQKVLDCRIVKHPKLNSS